MRRMLLGVSPAGVPVVKHCKLSQLQQLHCSRKCLHLLHHSDWLYCKVFHIRIFCGNLCNIKPSEIVGTRCHGMHDGLLPAFVLCSQCPGAGQALLSLRSIFAAKILANEHSGGTDVGPCRLRMCRLLGAGVQCSRATGRAVGAGQHAQR